LIGPGLASEVSKRLNANTGIETVEINSIGGLINEALEVARLIQANGELNTKATQTCNSACIVVFMAGNKRFSAHDLEFGFHATSAITKLGGIYDQQAIDSEGKSAVEYLKKRGIPEEYIAGARAKGAKSLYMVPAVSMAEVGAVSELLVGEKPVSIVRAKWLNVVEAVGRTKVPKSMVHLFETIEEHDPATVEKHAPGLWLAMHKGNSEAVVQATHDLVYQLTGKAVVSADDEPLMTMIKATVGELQYLRDNQYWTQCVGLLNGKGLSGVSPPPKLLDADFAAQIAAIESASRNGWVVKSVPNKAKINGEAIAATVAGRMTSLQIDLEQIDNDPRVSCEWSTRLKANPKLQRPVIYMHPDMLKVL
jgi:hypothetical protein